MDQKKPLTVEDLQAERDRIAKGFDELEKKSEDPKYQDRHYAKDQALEINGDLFTDFVNTQADTKVTLSTIQQNLIAAHNAIEVLTNRNAQLTLDLMKMHMQFIDQGKTISREDFNKLNQVPEKEEQTKQAKPKKSKKNG